MYSNNYALVFKKLQGVLGDKNVYPFLPLQEVAYPFATFEEETETVTSLKNGTVSETDYSFDLWGKNRKEIKDIQNEMQYYLYDLNAYNITKRLLIDTSTEQVLYHGIVEFKIKE